MSILLTTNFGVAPAKSGYPSQVSRTPQRGLGVNKPSVEEWVSSLEEMIDNKLRRWVKEPRLDTDDVIQYAWRWKHSRMILNVFWRDGGEGVCLQYASPRVSHEYRWHGLVNQTFNRVMDRVGNLAQTTMYPPIEPRD